MRTKTTKIVGLLLTMLVLVATLGAFAVTASAADTTTATLSFSSTANRKSQTSSQQVWEQNGIVFTNDKAASSNAIIDSSNPVRLYQNSSILVECPNMTKIVFDCNNTSYATALKNSIGTVSGASVTVSSDKVTVTFNAPVSSLKVAKLTAQVRMDSLTVTYKVDSGECLHTSVKAVDNGKGSHNLVCNDCGEVATENVEHTNDFTDNRDNSTHKAECTECGAVSEKVTHTSEFNCSDCGWTSPDVSFAEATINFDANKTHRTEQTTSKQTWENNGLVLVNNKASSTTNVGDYSDPVRFYASSTVTIEYPNMTKIVFDCTNSGDAKYFTALQTSIGTPENATVTVTNKILTIEFDSPTNSFTFTCSGQARVNKVTATSLVAKCPHEDTTAIDNGNGTHKVVCGECEEIVEEAEAHTSNVSCTKCGYVAPLTFENWSLTLQDNIAMNFALKAELITSGLYANPSVTFVIGEREIVVTEYNTEKLEGYYIFTLSDIAPHQMGEVVAVTLSATKNSETVSSTSERTIKAYCMQVLADTSKSEALKTLVVDLLNYGAASQTYVGSETTLVNADLTEEQKALGTADITLNTYADAGYLKVENATATWAGATLYLVDTVEMNFVFRAESTEGLSVKITTADPLNAEATGKTYTITEFTTAGEGTYVASFRGFSAAQMREIVYVTVCDAEGNAVSNTYRYSIESYAYAKEQGTDANLATLVVAMMKYGTSAKNYIG